MGFVSDDLRLCRIEKREKRQKLAPMGLQHCNKIS